MNRFSQSSSVVHSFFKFLKSFRLLFRKNYFLICLDRNEDGDFKGSLVCKGTPYYPQILALQAFINNELASTFVDGNYKVSAADFIDYMPEVKIMGDNSVKIGIGIFDTKQLVLRMHNTTHLKLKKAPKLGKKDLLKSVMVIFK